MTYKTNPRYRLHIDSINSNNYLFIELKGPKQFDIGFEVVISSIADSSITAPFRSEITKPYRCVIVYKTFRTIFIWIFRSGFIVMELENIPSGVLHVIPSTFLPGQQGPYILTVKCSAKISITREQWTFIDFLWSDINFGLNTNLNRV